MYNQKLNDQWLNELRAYCKDKRVIIVGNSVSLLNEEYGNLIDSYDVVVRMGKGVPLKRYQKNLGSRTDVWFFASFRAGMNARFKSARFKIMNFLQIGFYDPKEPKLTFGAINFKEEFQVYRDYFLAGSYEDQKTICEKVYPESNAADWKNLPRISQGTFCIAFFQEHVNTYAELNIIGFDFFESELNYSLGDTKRKVWSWHVPVPRANEPHPHDSKTEKAFVESRAEDNSYRTNLYKMNANIPKQLHDNIVKDLRPGAIVE